MGLIKFKQIEGLQEALNNAGGADYVSYSWLYNSLNANTAETINILDETSGAVVSVNDEDNGGILIDFQTRADFQALIQASGFVELRNVTNGSAIPIRMQPIAYDIVSGVFEIRMTYNSINGGLGGSIGAFVGACTNGDVIELRIYHVPDMVLSVDWFWYDQWAATKTPITGKTWFFYNTFRPPVYVSQSNGFRNVMPLEVSGVITGKTSTGTGPYTLTLTDAELEGMNFIPPSRWILPEQSAGVGFPNVYVNGVHYPNLPNDTQIYWNSPGGSALDLIILFDFPIDADDEIQLVYKIPYDWGV